MLAGLQERREDLPGTHGHRSACRPAVVVVRPLQHRHGQQRVRNTRWQCQMNPVGTVVLYEGLDAARREPCLHLFDGTHGVKAHTPRNTPAYDPLWSRALIRHAARSIRSRPRTRLQAAGRFDTQHSGRTTDGSNEACQWASCV